MEENTKEVGLLETISGSGNERSILANEPKTVKLTLREGCGVAEDPDGLWLEATKGPMSMNLRKGKRWQEGDGEPELREEGRKKDGTS